MQDLCPFDDSTCSAYRLNEADAFVIAELLNLYPGVQSITYVFKQNLCLEFFHLHCNFMATKQSTVCIL